MKLDFVAFYTWMENQLRLSADFATSVHAVCDWLEESVPHKDWSKVRSLDANVDLQSAREWLPAALQSSPCPFEAKAIFFGLTEIMGEEDDYGNYGPEHADLYPVLFARYDADDDTLQWLYGDDRHDFDDLNANLKGLKEAGLIFNSSTEAIGNECYIAYSVAYAALLLRHLLDGKMYSTLQCKDAIGIATGFSSGDLFCLGEFSADGLELRSKPMIAAAV